MNIAEAQAKVLKLLRLAAGAPNTEEARTAATMACKLIVEYGLLIMKPSDLVQVPLPAAPSPAPTDASSKKKRRKRPSAKEIQGAMSTAAETATTALDAAGRVAKAVNGFRNAIRGA